MAEITVTGSGGEDKRIEKLENALRRVHSVTCDSVADCLGQADLSSTPSESEGNELKDIYNRPTIRELLTQGLSDQELTEICSDYFQPLYQTFGTNESKSKKISDLMDYCQRHRQFEDLLKVVKKKNPEMYTHYEHKLTRLN